MQSAIKIIKKRKKEDTKAKKVLGGWDVNDEDRVYTKSSKNK